MWPGIHKGWRYSLVKTWLARLVAVALRATYVQINLYQEKFGSFGDAKIPKTNKKCQFYLHGTAFINSEPSSNVFRLEFSQ